METGAREQGEYPDGSTGLPQIMKYLLVLGDGMADEPIPELGGKTPLEAAVTPNMDEIAENGAMGQLTTVPGGFVPGSDIANLSVLGYDPRSQYTGRGPLEAANMGVDLRPDEIAYRCNLVTIRNGIMEDFSAGHISSREGAELLASLNKKISGGVSYPGVSYRNLLVIPGEGCESVAPHDIVSQKIDAYLPKGPDAAVLKRDMEISEEVFADHPVNRERIREGKQPVTTIWPWSGGKKPSLPQFSEKYHLNGGMISAVDLLNGIARYAGMEIITVPGATGYLDTDYHAKGVYAVEALKRLDFVYLHVEAPDEAGHMGDLNEKILAIERIDTMIGEIREKFHGRIALLPDHPTPISKKTHTSTPVPFAILGRDKDETRSFSEREAANGIYGLREAHELLPLLFS